MVTFEIQEEICKGCGLCVRACPKNILTFDPERLNAKGYHPVIMTDVDACIACGSCFRTCPDTAIHILKS